jgi:alanyl-tRNA synthetase
VEEGHLETAQACRLEVDEKTRRATERNHTATHLLHAALKNLLGNHVSQAGSEVASQRLRFDYTHPDRLSRQQIEDLEGEVNGQIAAATVVEARIRSMDEAKGDGFIALFGEKYGDRVRGLAVGEYSKELCGGTHVANTGNIGGFRITGDSAISAGTRRLEAVTGAVAMELAQAERETLAGIAQTLKVPGAEVAPRITLLVEENRKLRKQLEKAQAADLDQLTKDLKAAAVATDRGHTVVFECPGLTAKEVQELLVRASKSLAPFAGVVLARADTEVRVGAAVSPDLIDRIRANDLVREVSKAMGGGGGGRPELAQGKGRNPANLPQAVRAARDLLAQAGFQG